ncbi:MAG: YSC84-related protein [Gammaproteobacteria bacterium]
MRTLTLIVALAFALTATFVQAGWNPLADDKSEKSSAKGAEVAETIATFKTKDPGIRVFFDKAYGYAVFPTVGKGGMGIGAAYGKGEVYQRGKLIGTSSLSQLTIGLQLGGQAYSEIIFFKDKATLDRFTSGSFEFSAQASAVALTAGASADADYSNGVAIFTLAKGGLMYEASVGGQKFGFTPR